MHAINQTENKSNSHAAHPSLGKAGNPEKQARNNHRAAVIAAIGELQKAIGQAQQNGLFLDSTLRDNPHDAITAIYDGALSDAENLIWSLGSNFYQKEESYALGRFAFAVANMIFDFRTPY